MAKETKETNEQQEQTAVAEVRTNSFSITDPYEGLTDEMREALADEAEDMAGTGGITFRKIKMPSGDSKAFSIESDREGDPDLVKEFTGVLLYTHRINGRFVGDYSADNKFPVCSSWDGRQGVLYETGEVINCDQCPHNKFKEEGGKDCRNQRRLYLLLDGKPQLYVLSVPPTSLKSVEKSINTIKGANPGRTFTSMSLRFKLEGAVSKNGQNYAKIIIEKAENLDPDQVRITLQMRNEVKTQYKSIGIEDESEPRGSQNYIGQRPPANADSTGFMDIPDEIGEELPFA